jgi:Fic family protein
MRPSHEWISRINQKQKQLAELEISEEQRKSIERWTEIEFVYSTLVLEGYEISREDVSRLASSQTTEAASESDRQASALLESLRRVKRLARQRGKNASLSPELLLELHNLPGSEAGLRRRAGNNSASPPPERLRAAVESACHWFTAESFTEFNPVEQASLVLLRLIDIEPFDRANERTALVAASLFTLRSELPPVIIEPEMQAAYRAARAEGMRMNTKPMVDLIAAATEKSITAAIKEI